MKTLQDFGKEIDITMEPYRRYLGDDRREALYSHAELGTSGVGYLFDDECVIENLEEGLWQNLADISHQEHNAVTYDVLLQRIERLRKRLQRFLGDIEEIL